MSSLSEIKFLTVAEVAAVKRTQHGIIGDPHAIDEHQRVRDAAAVMERTHVGTLVVVDDEKRLKGVLTERDVRFVQHPFSELR